MTSRPPARRREVNEISQAAEPVRIDLERRREGEAARFIERVFAEQERRIHGLVLASLRDPELAADVTQEAFLRLLREARAGRYPDSAGAWLYRTALNLAVSRARRAAVARRFAPRLVRRDDPPTPEEVSLGRERSALMRAALARLPQVQRTALIMAAQGIGGEQIAAQLGKSHGATRTLLLRARRQLRLAVEHEEAGR